MCVQNSSAVSLAAEVERLNWAAEIRERELDRLINRDRKIGHMLQRMQKVATSNALPEVKVAIIKSMCERGPIFPNPNEIPNT